MVDSLQTLKGMDQNSSLQSVGSNFRRWLDFFKTAFVLTAVTTVVASCSTTHENPQLTLMDKSQSEQVVEKFTSDKKVYDGFQAVMDVAATLHNSEVRSALIDKNARIYQWNTDQYTAEKSKSESEKVRQTEIFLSFFVPERKHDDLARASTKWKIFLDVNGRRYEGKVARIKTILADVQAQYPYHTRWNTPYRLTFPVPTTDVDGQQAALTLTGPVGSVKLEFER